MKFTALAMRNFRRFEDARIEFPDGVIGVVGRNGSGKSTILEAIGWCLFGHDAARTGKDLIRRHGAEEKADCSVTVAFTFSGHAYEVTRHLKGKSQSHAAEVKVDGRVVVPMGAQSHKEATAYLERAFHMDRHAFFVSLVTRQRELAALTDLTPGGRQKVLMSMLRIDAVDDAVRAVRETKRETRARLDALGSQVAEPEVLDKREAEARAALKDAAEARDRLAMEVDALDGRVKEARATRDAWERKAEEHHRVAERLAGLRERAAAARRESEETRGELTRLAGLAVELEGLAPEAKALPAAREHVERVTTARQRFEEAKRRMEDLKKARERLARMEADLERAEQDVTKLSPTRKMLERAEAALERKREDERQLADALSDVKARVATLKAERDRVRTHLENVRRLGADSPCPTCTRRIGDHFDALTGGFEADITRVEGELSDAESRHAKLQADAQQLRADAASLQESAREYRRKAEALTTVVSRRETLAENVTAERERVDALAKTAQDLAAEPVSESAVREARERVQNLERVAQRVTTLEAQVGRRTDLERLLDAQRVKVKETEEALSGAETELKAVAFDPEAHQAARRAFDDAQSALQEKRVFLERASAAIARAEESLNHVAAERARQEKLREEIEALRADLDVLERLAGDRDGGLLVQFKHHLVGRIRPLLSAHAGTLFRDLTEGKYADLEVDENYDLLVHEDGDAFGLTRFSGGEGDLANLCLRLAVSRVLAERAGGADFQFIALDEIFGSQDEVRKQNILRALAELRGQFRQILVITHVDDVKDHCEHVLRVTENADGVSTVTLE